MKKVLHVTLFLDIGGLERMVLLLSRGQRASGWQPHVFVYGKGTGALAPQFEAAGIPLRFAPKGRRFSLRLPFRILLHARRNGISLLHSHDLGALIYSSIASFLSLGRLRVVHTQHSFLHLHELKPRVYERIFPWFAGRLVCVSEDIRRTYLDLGQPYERLRLVPNGVDFQRAPANQTERDDLRA
jgi:glycosyltransferase involved in cell wall biosynthesis